MNWTSKQSKDEKQIKNIRYLTGHLKSWRQWKFEYPFSRSGDILHVTSTKKLPSYRSGAFFFSSFLVTFWHPIYPNYVTNRRSVWIDAYLIISGGRWLMRSRPIASPGGDARRRTTGRNLFAERRCYRKLIDRRIRQKLMCISLTSR